LIFFNKYYKRKFHIVAISTPTPVPVGDVPGIPVQPVPLSAIDRAPDPVAVPGATGSIPVSQIDVVPDEVPVEFVPVSTSSGRQGPQGPTGPQGPAGPQGFTGATGSGSGSGSIGATGASGIQGLTGATGTAGTNGATGPQGNTGATGASGIQGEIGATGASGTQGLTGATGSFSSDLTANINGQGYSISNVATISTTSNVTAGNVSTGIITLTNGAVIKDTAGEAVAFGQSAGQTSQGLQAVAIGALAGSSAQGNNSVAIGALAGSSAQGINSVAIGYFAGNAQGNNSVAIGADAGGNTQGNESVAVGGFAGGNTQGNESVAIGYFAGSNAQSISAVAVGSGAGANIQGIQAVAIGHVAGSEQQGLGAVALGYFAGGENQGQYSVAIGRAAGRQNQGNNSIIINATSDNLNQTTANTFTVAPVRNDVANTAQVMFYNTSSKEITYGNTISVAGNITGNYILGNGSQLTGLPAPTVAQDITSNGAMSIMTYDGNIKYVSYATVEPSSGNITGGNISTTGNVIAGNINSSRLNNSGNISVVASGNTWTFGTNGSLTFPIGISIDNSVDPLYPKIIADSGKLFSVQGQGANGSAALAWSLNPNTDTQYAAVGVNQGGGDNLAKVVLTAGNTTATLKVWKFDETGNLNLPRGGIVYETSIPGGFDGNTIALKPSGGTNADQQLLVYPTANITDANHLHLTSGNLYNTELFLGSDDLYVKLANTGNIVVNSNDNTGNTAQWTFSSNGNLTIPGGMIINGNINTLGSQTALLQSTDDLPLSFIASGANGSVTSFWAEDFANLMTSNIAAIYTPLQSTQTVRIVTGTNGGNVAIYDFDPDGMFTAGAVCATGNVYASNVIVATGIVGSGASPAPSLSGFSSIATTGASGNITASGNLIVTAGSAITTPKPLANLTAVAGARAFVSDANLIAAGNFGNQISGGASNTVPVWSDGTNWYIG
jgi:hypothetical protein